jgi:6-phosphogluconolactonase (cycloisomerase 2 family)
MPQTNGYFLSAQSGDTGGLTWAEVSGGFSFNAVTGATPSLDVGSYNFFDNGTLAANTTVSFASVPTEANWKYTFEVGTGNAWDISTASYTGKSFDGIGSFDWGSLFFKADGRRLFTVDADSDTIDEFILQVPWDIETAIYNISSPTIVGEGSPRGLFIKPDGTSYYVIGPSSDTVIQYNMSRAWDLTSATAGVTYATTQTLQASEIFFKEDGLKMYVLCPYNDAVYQYTLSTEWAVNTASYASKSFSTLSQDTNPHGMFFSSDGTKMYILGLTNDTVYQYTLSTAWDLATASYATKSFSVASEETSPRGMFIKPDGGAMYVIGSVPAAGGDDKIFQYDIGNITLTLPAAIENPPTEPLVLGSRYTYDFFTEDAGTTVTLLSENKE